MLLGDYLDSLEVLEMLVDLICCARLDDCFLLDLCELGWATLDNILQEITRIQKRFVADIQEKVKLKNISERRFYMPHLLPFFNVNPTPLHVSGISIESSYCSNC